MAQNQLMQSFEVRNSDVCIKFNCPNHKKRINECIQNLQIDRVRLSFTVENFEECGKISCVKCGAKLKK